MKKRKTNRVAWGLAAILGAVVLGSAGADLHGVDMRGARLYYVNLAGAILSGTELHGADLRGTILKQADLQSANLCGAVLRHTDLTGEKLTGARYDARTRWPTGFDPLRHGAVEE
jgi:uncharacterized protein YjbI with pentapeptide repeats